MLIRLTQHVMEGNNVKTTVRPNKEIVIPWVAGTVLDASEVTAAKLIKAGKARLLTEEENAVELERIGNEMREANVRAAEKAAKMAAMLAEQEAGERGDA